MQTRVEPLNIEYRPITESELAAFEAAEDSAYSNGPSPDDRAAFKTLFDFDRSLAAFDDDQIVGGACYFRLGLSVPGAEIPAGGVTFVFVVPTHRRRGIVTELMHRQLAAMREEGIAVAGLHAAESSIYGRFGYGAAAHTETVEIEQSHANLKSPVQPAGRFRLIDDAEAARVFPTVYDSYRSYTPGLFARDEGWWNLRLRKHGNREGSPGWMKVVYERDGQPAAYAVYVVNMNWQNAIPQSQLQVEEIAFVDSESYAAIWQYLLNVDLIKSIRAYASVDPPIWWMLSDPRRLNRSTRDGLWTRFTDLPAALAGRKYMLDGSIVIEVKDEFCPWNTGVFRLAASTGDASCESTGDAPDLTIGSAALASVYLGGSNLHTLANAGLVHEHTNGALARATAMFSWHTAPMTSAPEPLT